MATYFTHRFARRILLIFGWVWLVFIVLSNTGREWQGITSLLMQGLLALPFFGLGWLACRRPRLAGGLLLAMAAYFVWLFDLYRVAVDPFGTGNILVLAFFVGPLVLAGVILVRKPGPRA